MIAYERDATLLRFFEVRNTKICDEYNIQYTIGSKKNYELLFYNYRKDLFYNYRMIDHYENFCGKTSKFVNSSMFNER